MDFRPRDNNIIIRILLNILGILVIILGGLTGWLPGPWFVLGMITGLTLLARNNFWAYKHLLNARKKVSEAKDKIIKKKSD